MRQYERACSETEVVYDCSSIGNWVYTNPDLAVHLLLDLIIISARMGFIVTKSMRGDTLRLFHLRI